METKNYAYESFACVLTQITEQTENAFVASAAKKLQNELADLVDPMLNRYLSENNMISCTVEGIEKVLK